MVTFLIHFETVATTCPHLVSYLMLCLHSRVSVEDGHVLDQCVLFAVSLLNGVVLDEVRSAEINLSQSQMSVAECVHDAV